MLLFPFCFERSSTVLHEISNHLHVLAMLTSTSSVIGFTRRKLQNNYDRYDFGYIPLFYERTFVSLIYLMLVEA